MHLLEFKTSEERKDVGILQRFKRHQFGVGNQACFKLKSIVPISTISSTGMDHDFGSVIY